jgi:hypothetical protein
MKDETEPLDILWGVAAIAGYIRRDTRAAYHLLETGQISGRKKGKLWISTRRELAADLGPDTTAQAR